MVREESVRRMSRIAIYEKNEGRKEIPMSAYYKNDYVRLHALKAIVSATVAYVLIVGLVAVYQLEYLLANVLKMDYKQLLLLLLAGYGIWVFLYWIIARVVYAKRYENARPHIIIYNHNLKKLLEENRKESVKAKGGVVIHDDFIDF